MNIRVWIALSIGAIVSSPCTAEQELRTTVTVNAASALYDGYEFGALMEKFQNECGSLDVESWFTSRGDIEKCYAYLLGIHYHYRHLSPHVGKDELIGVRKPFTAVIDLQHSTRQYPVKVTCQADYIYRKYYRLNNAYNLKVDRDGKLKEYTNDKREVIQYSDPKDLQSLPQ